MEIQARVALVTGAGAGIGHATALRLAREGASVVVADVDEGAGAGTVRQIKAGGGQAVFVATDVASEADVREVVAVTEDEFGGLDILVNNAGGVTAPHFPEAEPEHWGSALDLNLRGVMLGIHFGVQAMRKRGGGAIVNISSIAGVGFGPHGAPEYAASKAGVMRLTAALAPLKDQGIRVNCICPGWVDTPASRRTRAEMTPEERKKSVPPVLLQPEEISDAVVMFVEDEAMAGRVMVWREGEPWQIVPLDSPY